MYFYLVFFLMEIISSFNLHTTEKLYAKPLVNNLNFEVKVVRVKSISYRNNTYKELIELMKYHEGFRATAYDDGGYPCIGYGQRLEFFDKTIKDTITKHEAELILIASFNNHIRLVKSKFKGLNTFQQYAVAHMSYSIGIGNVINNKYLFKDKEGNWQINKYTLFNARKVDSKSNYRINREYEYKLFNL